MIYSNLTEQIFLNPIKDGAEELFILSGSASPNMASLFLKTLQDEKIDTIKNINLIIGMTVHNGISISNHNGFKSLQNTCYVNNIDNFSCSYVCEGKPIHSNLYIWSKDGIPMTAFAGSADFVQSAFLEQRKETMIKCDPVIAYNLYLDADKQSIYCNHAEVEDNVVIRRDAWIDDTTDGLSLADGVSTQTVKLSLLSRNKQIGTTSGLNWGQREGRNKNEAYIGVPINVSRDKFFPEDKHFTVLTDDGHFLILRTEQAQSKAITTPLSNAQLGEYFRNRLGLANGAIIQTNDLVEYGRTDVDFIRIDDEHYYMDFSV